jgi:hypothetical protein
VKADVQTWCFCVVNVVQLWSFVWLNVVADWGGRWDRVLGFIFVGRLPVAMSNEQTTAKTNAGVSPLRRQSAPPSVEMTISFEW